MRTCARRVTHRRRPLSSGVSTCTSSPQARCGRAPLQRPRLRQHKCPFASLTIPLQAQLRETLSPGFHGGLCQCLLLLFRAGSCLSLPVKPQILPLVRGAQHCDAWPVALQILGEPNTFRDAVTPEDEAHYDRARAACLQMWQQLQALRSTQHCKRVMEQPAAKHADDALCTPCQT